MSAVEPADTGALRVRKSTRALPERERFWALVEKGPLCWTWRGYIDSQGYGKFSPVTRIGMWAHRYAYLDVRGPIPDGLVLDHVCRNRSCVNPDHLEPVTVGTNNRRGIGPAAINARKTHCIHGHEFTPENTRILGEKARKAGTRVCRTCHTENQQRRRAALRKATS